MTRVFGCADCWDNPCTCSPERKIGRAWGEALRERRFRDWYDKLSPAEQRAHWNRTIEIELPVEDLEAMRLMGRAAARSLDDVVRRALKG